MRLEAGVPVDVIGGNYKGEAGVVTKLMREKAHVRLANGDSKLLSQASIRPRRARMREEVLAEAEEKADRPPSPRQVRCSLSAELAEVYQQPKATVRLPPRTESDPLTAHYLQAHPPLRRSAAPLRPLSAPRCGKC